MTSWQFLRYSSPKATIPDQIKKSFRVKRLLKFAISYIFTFGSSAMAEAVDSDVFFIRVPQDMSLRTMNLTTHGLNYYW
jgi:hypothetical protein